MSIIEEADIVILDDKVNFENDAIGIGRELDVPNFSTDISTDGTISFQLNEVNIMQRVSNQIFVDDFEMSNIIGNNQEMDLEENVNLESNVNKPLYEENQSLESNDTQIDDGVSKDNLQNDTNRHSYAKYGINENAFNTNTQRESDEGDPLYEFSGEENESLSSNDTRIDNQVHKDDLQDDKLKQKRSTKYKVDKNKWNVNTNRFNREKGKSYAGKKQENGVWKYDLVKGPRMLKINCNCKLSKNKNYKLQCRQLEEDTRKEIFEQFWNYTWKEKKIFIKSHVWAHPTVRKHGENEVSRRTFSNKFYLGKERLRVCKKMSLNTLGVNEWVIKKWVQSDLKDNHQALPNKPNSDQTSSARFKLLHDFFDSLPKLESHYCRASTSKLYLEPIWESKAHLYRIYRQFCTDHNTKPLSIAMLHKEFDNKKLSLYKPKKDLCDTCVAFETKNLSEEKYNEHLQLKKEARDKKSKDKESANDVFTMDLQSVLLCPKSNVSSLYYKTKLIVHNFTVYDIKRHQGYCYIWNESEGGLTSNEFTSIIIKFLEKHLKQYPILDNREIILYSDGCGYQNRNTTLSNALFNFALDKKIVIKQKILQKGHTQMEVDSVHSVIERKIKNKKINVPADYVQICKTACLKTPYKVKYLLHNFFKKCDDINFFKSIRPGRASGSPVVTDLKAIKYSKEGVFYKLRQPEDWQLLPIRLNVNVATPVVFDNLPPLHQTRLKIKTEKYHHLQQLKQSIKKDYHDFFDNLPHY
ncbi:unnamed protein product [Psylliodes chrysocephalus]|uniref:Uncharacterized protein n=1 Tax=Psylliodes chrysocephalus TaxID=3402493 RepID=A0A9P0D140_9CUCU|nr:unnamed protein product [Psylliodes chrysocephala]